MGRQRVQVVRISLNISSIELDISRLSDSSVRLLAFGSRELAKLSKFLKNKVISGHAKVLYKILEFDDVLIAVYRARNLASGGKGTQALKLRACSEIF